MQLASGPGPPAKLVLTSEAEEKSAAICGTFFFEGYRSGEGPLQKTLTPRKKIRGFLVKKSKLT